MTQLLKMPSPPPGHPYYDWESVKNRVLEETVNGKLGKEQLPQYPGTPVSTVKGSNNAFSVANGATPVIVGFDTSVKSTDVSTVLTGSTLVAGMTGDYDVEVRLRHAGVAGTGLNITIGAYVGGVLKDSSVISGKLLSDTFDVGARFMLPAVAKGAAIDIRVNHSYASAVLFDMTLSRLIATRVTADPTRKESRL